MDASNSVADNHININFNLPICVCERKKERRYHSQIKVKSGHV